MIRNLEHDGTNSLSYLKDIKNMLIEQKDFIKEIILILGNEASDLDSVLSSYLLSIAKNIENKVIVKNIQGKYYLNKNTEILYIPIIGCKRGELNYRLDVKYVLEENKIDQSDFLYANDELIKSLDLSKGNIHYILVDHSELGMEDLYLKDYVIEVYDHHFSNFKFPNLKRQFIKTPLGSCSTLILSQYFQENFPLGIISPKLAATAILVDTKNFKDEIYEKVWIDLDKKVFKNIWDCQKKERKEYYKTIHKIKTDENKTLDLGLKGILLMDQKKYYWNDYIVYWSSFPIELPSIYSKFGLDGFYEGMANQLNHINTDCLYIGGSTFNGQKIFGFYTKGKKTLNIDKFKSNFDNRRPGDLLNIYKVTDFFTLAFFDKEYKRKQLEPIIREFFYSCLE